MTPIMLEVYIGLIAFIVCWASWYRHYSVPNGLGRMMLLWGCGCLGVMIGIRVVSYFMLDVGIISLASSQIINNMNFGFIYLIVFGQAMIQFTYSVPTVDHIPAQPKEKRDMLLWIILLLVLLGRIGQYYPEIKTFFQGLMK